MATHILVVDDETAIADLVEVYLKNEGFTIHKFYNASDALACVRTTRLNLAVLDVMLPDMDGFTLCQRIREDHLFPIIMLTAKVEDMDKIMGLTLGADDYITKPFSLAVLRARVNAQLRRGAPQVSPPLSMGPFAFDFEQMDFRRDGRLVELSKTEQKLLRVLVENRGHAVPRATLVDRVWTDGAEFVEENALSVTVKRLRSKLEADPSRPEYLKTVYGIGYTWAVKP